MELLIVRHGIAVDRGGPGMTDEERPLTQEGEEKFREAARGLARFLPAPELLLTSPLVRARRTAEIAAEAWGKVRLVESDVLSGGKVARILAMLREHHARSSLALFGHEPDVSTLVARLLGSSHAERVEFKKGGAALLDVDDGAGRLLWFAPQKLLRTIGS